MRQPLLQCFNLVAGVIRSQERRPHRRGIRRVCKVGSEAIGREQGGGVQLPSVRRCPPRSAEHVVIVVYAAWGQKVCAASAVGCQGGAEARESPTGTGSFCLHGVDGLLKIWFVTLQSGSVFAGVSDIRFMLGLHFLDDVLETLGFILVLFTGIAWGGEEFREPLVLAFQSLAGCLWIGELGAQLLEGDFEIPVFFFEFVCTLFLLSECSS
jgi:hypothetical protein